MLRLNAQITTQMQNAYTNMANTYNMNTLYPNFNVRPKYAGVVDITNPRDYNKDPNYQSPESLSEQYVNFRQSFPPNTSEDSIPSFTEWHKISYGNKKSNTDAEGIQGINYPNSIGSARRGKEIRLAKSGMELRKFFKGGQY